MYLLFGGLNYYASGGMHDLLETSGDLVELIESGKRRMKDKPAMYAIDWWHIVAADKPGEIVAGTTVQAYSASDLPGDGDFYEKGRKIGDE